jgi:hypothetical protein
MTTVNMDIIKPENIKLANTINSLGEILMYLDIRLYTEIVNKINVYNEKENQKNFLQVLYIHMLEKLKEVKF